LASPAFTARRKKRFFGSRSAGTIPGPMGKGANPGSRALRFSFRGLAENVPRLGGIVQAPAVAPGATNIGPCRGRIREFGTRPRDSKHTTRPRSAEGAQTGRKEGCPTEPKNSSKGLRGGPPRTRLRGPAWTKGRRWQGAGPPGERRPARRESTSPRDFRSTLDPRSDPDVTSTSPPTTSGPPGPPGRPRKGLFPPLLGPQGAPMAGPVRGQGGSANPPRPFGPSRKQREPTWAADPQHPRRKGNWDGLGPERLRFRPTKGPVARALRAFEGRFSPSPRQKPAGKTEPKTASRERIGRARLIEVALLQRLRRPGSRPTHGPSYPRRQLAGA